MSFLADVLLVSALVVTSAFVVAMQRRLKQLDASHHEYQKALTQTATALLAARDALEKVNTEGRSVSAQLSDEIAQARALAADLERQRGAGSEARPYPVSLMPIRTRTTGGQAGSGEPGRISGTTRHA